LINSTGGGESGLDIFVVVFIYFCGGGRGSLDLFIHSSLFVFEVMKSFRAKKAGHRDGKDELLAALVFN